MSGRQIDSVPAPIRSALQSELARAGDRAWALLSEAVTLRAIYLGVVERASEAAGNPGNFDDTFFDDVGVNDLWRPMQLTAATLLDHSDAVSSSEEASALAVAAGVSPMGDIVERLAAVSAVMGRIVERLDEVERRVEQSRADSRS